MSRASDVTHLRVIRWSSHLIGAACLSLIGFASLRGYCLVAGERAALACRHRANTAVVMQRAELEANHQLLKEQSAALTAVLAEMKKENPDSMHESEFLSLITQHAESKQVNLRDFRQGSVSVRGGQQEMEIVVSATGKYGDMCRFLDGLSQLPSICRVQQLSLTAPTAAEMPCSAELRLGLTIATNQAVGEGKGGGK